MKKYLSVFLLLSLLNLISINVGSQNIYNSKTYGGGKEIEHIRLETFKYIPEGIVGASCGFYLSKSDQKESKYILVTDLADTAYMAINGRLEKLILKSHQSNPDVSYYSNKDYQLIITVRKKKKDANELTIKKGTLKVKNVVYEMEVDFLSECAN